MQNLAVIRFIRIGSLISMLLLMFFFSNGCFSQTSTLNGVIWDQVNKIPISYTSITFIHNNTGITSAEDGKFTIKIDTSTLNDTLAFARVGYQTKRISVKEFSVKNNPTVFLCEKPVELKAITISTTKGKAQKHRKTIVLNDVKYKRDKVKIFWIKGSHGSQQAVLFKFNAKTKSDWFIDKIKITLASGETSNQPMKFNIRLYAYDSINNQPGEELYNKPILVNGVNDEIKEVNLRDYKIQIPPDYFFVAVEWLILDENKYKFLKIDKPSNLYLPVLVELKESKDITGVWDLDYNQNWRKRPDMNGGKNSLDISVILRN